MVEIRKLKKGDILYDASYWSLENGRLCHPKVEVVSAKGNVVRVRYLSEARAGIVPRSPQELLSENRYLT